MSPGMAVKIRPGASICVHPQTGADLDNPGATFLVVEVSPEDGFVRGKHHVEAGAMGYFQHEVEPSSAVSGQQATGVRFDECEPAPSVPPEKGKKFSVGQLITITESRPCGANLEKGDHCVVKIVEKGDYGVSKIGDSNVWWITPNQAELTDFMPKAESPSGASPGLKFKVGDLVRVLHPDDKTFSQWDFPAGRDGSEMMKMVGRDFTIASAQERPSGLFYGIKGPSGREWKFQEHVLELAVPF